MSNSGATSNFVREEVIKDMESGRFTNIMTRFPPEPNGYLHIGHAMAICLDFGIAREFGGQCNLRFDDTNPVKEDEEYVQGIQNDINWLGFQWDGLYHASDYFDQLYAWAIQLIKQGDAYVDDLSQEEMREYRGTLTEPGKNSPYRDRSIEENLDLFERMKNGEFPEGSRILRAKIDMASGNIIMRDPAMYRILHQVHHQTGDKWCIYPMYDFAHGQSDSIEGVSHSLCSLEYRNHRPLYNWFVEKLGIYAPRQIEFGRVSLSHTIVSKRKLRVLVEQGVVSGWDDPRMPTLAGIRRRGITPESIRNFCDMIGVAKSNSTVPLAQFEFSVREHLNKITPRVMGVLDPLKVVITNYPDDQIELLDVKTYPQDRSNTTTRPVPFSKVLYIEREDFAETPPGKWKRMAPGREIRLFGAYFVKTTDVVKDADGNVIEIHCTYDPATRGGNSPDRRKVKGTIHWVSAEKAIPATVNLYSTLFNTENPGSETGDFLDDLNPESLVVIQAMVEPSLTEANPGDQFQFMRMGYFTIDKDSTPDNLIFDRTVTLRDNWSKSQKKK